MVQVQHCLFLCTSPPEVQYLRDEMVLHIAHCESKCADLVWWRKGCLPLTILSVNHFLIWLLKAEVVDASLSAVFFRGQVELQFANSCQPYWRWSFWLFQEKKKEACGLSSRCVLNIICGGNIDNRAAIRSSWFLKEKRQRSRHPLGCALPGAAAAGGGRRGAGPGRSRGRRSSAGRGDSPAPASAHLRPPRCHFKLLPLANGAPPARWHH